MDAIPLYFVVLVKNGQVVGVDSGPYVDFDLAKQGVEKHLYTAQNYKIAEVSLPFKLIEVV